MKKWSAALLGMALSTPVMAHQHGFAPFSGIYGGVNAGIIQSEIKVNSSANILFQNTTLSFSESNKFTDITGEGGVQLGFAWCFENMFIAAIEGRANFSDLKTHIVNADINANIPLGPTFLAETDTEVKLRNDFALLAKLGYMFDEDFLFYGLIGADWGHFRVSTEGSLNVTNGREIFNATLNERFSRYKAGLLLGLGMEYLVTRCASIGLEYNYVDYRRLRSENISEEVLLNGIGIAGSTFSANNNFKARTNKMALFFNFYFS